MMKKNFIFLAITMASIILLAGCPQSQTPSSNPVTSATQYTLTVSNNGNGTTTSTPEGTSLDKNAAVTVTATADSGYHFVRWDSDDGSNISSNNPYNFTLTANRSLKAIFIENNSYAINITAPNATVTLTPAQYSYATGTSVTVSIVPKTGYQFTGWTSGLTGTSRTGTVIIGAADISLTATIVERWLVLVHFAIDNNIDYQFEGVGGIITNYLNTLEAVKAADTADVMDILVLMDGYTADDPWETEYETDFEDGYYALTGGAFAADLEQATGEINSGSVATTKAFMDWAYANYSGRRVMYSVFNHGGGFDDLNVDATFSSYGIGFDDSNGSDSLSHNEFAQTAAYLKGKAGKNIDLLYPYACLMGGVELAWEVRESADILLSSEEVFPAEEWSYEALGAITANPAITGAELGEAFCDNAYTYFSGAPDRSFTLSVVDLSALQPLYDTVNSLGAALSGAITADPANAALLDGAAQTALYMHSPYYSDIGILMGRIAAVLPGESAKTATVQTALESAVLHTSSFTSSYDDSGKYDEISGLSIYHNIWDAQNYGFDYAPSLYSSILTFGKTNAWGTYTQKMNALKPEFVPPGPAADAYEPDGLSNAHTNVLSIGIANGQHHTFHFVEKDIDFDMMTVNLTAGKTYTFETEAGDVTSDTSLALLNSAEEYLVGNGDIDYPANPYSKATWTATVTGPHYLVIYDNYRLYGDYWVYYDEGTWGMTPGTQYRKWTPLPARTGNLF